MLSIELDVIIKEVLERKCESQYLEIKKSNGGTPERLYDTLSSFSNQSGGGIILFGIDEKSNFDVCGVYNAQDLQVKVTQQALQMVPIVRPVFTITTFNGKTVVSAEISECDTTDKPCFYSGAGRLRGSYIRVGDADILMSEYEIYAFEAYKKKIRDELRAVERASIQDFDADIVDEYFVKVRKDKVNLAKHNKDKVLSLQGLVSEGKPTVAGVMILGEYPQAFCPQMCITAVVVEGTEYGCPSDSGARFIDNKRIEGTIPQMLEGALSFVRRNMKVATVINNEGVREDRTEYPIKAVREVILNALVHRDYSIHTEDSPIRIIMYKDRMEVENPGGLYGRITIEDLGKGPADTRNPFIASNLEVMIDTENRFSGIPTIHYEMAKAGLREPIFESKRGAFKAILYNSIRDKAGKGIEDIENDTQIEQKIQQYCTQARTKEEIAEYLGMTSVYYMMNRYVKPMLKRGKLKMTMPEKPQSKFQKFIAVKS